MSRISKGLRLKETIVVKEKKISICNISLSGSTRVPKELLLKNKVKIFCNAEETEYNYFSSLKKLIDSQKIADISIEVNKKKAGKSPKKLVEYAIEKREEANNVWVVFDKDHYDIEEAIILAKKNNIDVAWSNESFELWLLYHFKDVCDAIGRKECFDVLSKEYEKFFKEEYKKNGKNHFEKFSANIKIAKARALKRWQLSKRDGKNYNETNPCTTVFGLVKCLEKYIIK